MNETQMKRLKYITSLTLLAACGPEVSVEPARDMSMTRVDQGRDMERDDSVPDDEGTPDMKPDLADMTPDLGPCGVVCSEENPICDTVRGICLTCVRNEDCVGNSNGEACLIDAADPTMNRCVECAGDSDCLIPGQPTSPDDELTCDPGTNTCVQCLTNAECVAETASLCIDSACAGCTVDDDCSHLPGGKTICDVDAGICRGCTPENEEINCGGNTCDPDNFTCTDTEIDTLANCDPCVSDSDCAGDAGCVDMTFGANNVDVGSYCLPKVINGTCAPLYSNPQTFTTLSGETGIYCSLKNSITSCPAVSSLNNSVSCTAAEAGTYPLTCGISGEDDGICVLYDALMNYRCSIRCLTKEDCQEDEMCKQVGNEKVCVQN